LNLHEQLYTNGGTVVSLLKEIFKGGEGLVEQAQQETIHALDSSKEMFLTVTKALKEEVNADVLDYVRKMDKKINREQRDVRKKIYEHLSISGGKDLFSSLVLLFVMDHVERIGDYSKNIGDLVEMVPAELDFGEYEKDFENVKTLTTEIFDITRRAFAETNEEAAIEVLRGYKKISKNSKAMLRQVMAQASEKERVPSFYLALVLLLRYMRRVGAHLTSISTTVINPFHRIGYGWKKKRKPKK
jgi:phosphate uptake regulator